jgi:hypothetical protein
LSLAHGVGHIFAAAANPLRGLLKSKSPRFSASFARGVGHNPDTFPDVGSANVNRSDNAPSRIIPHRGKITEDAGKSASNKQR